jgi:putative iron-dependent peroxidase
MAINEGSEDTVHDLLADLAGLKRAAGSRNPEALLSLVAGFGSVAWDRLFSGSRPRELHEFREVRRERHSAPSTAGDLLFHIRARKIDLCFELATLVMNRLQKSVAVNDETHGFKYFDQRDLLGFVDGAENPTGSAAAKAVEVGEEDPEFSSSSYVVVQKYFHFRLVSCARQLSF